MIYSYTTYNQIWCHNCLKLTKQFSDVFSLSFEFYDLHPEPVKTQNRVNDVNDSHLVILASNLFFKKYWPFPTNFRETKHDLFYSFASSAFHFLGFKLTFLGLVSTLIPKCWTDFIFLWELWSLCWLSVGNLAIPYHLFTSNPVSNYLYCI